MKAVYIFFFAIFLLETITAHSTAFAACDPTTDEFCCTKDSDCTMYVDPALWTFLALNKTTAEKREKENHPPSGECRAEYVEKLKKDVKAMTPVCISHGCDFR